MTVTQLREQYPRFIYRNAKATLTELGLELQFTFVIEPEFTFRPKVVIPGVSEQQWLSFSEEWRQRWVFNVGMAEVPSYWKTTCSPEIVVEAGELSAAQAAWWKELLLRGMGEFFYVNNIDFTAPDFLTVHSQANTGLGELEPATAGLGSQTATLQPDAPAQSAGRAVEPAPTPHYLIPIGGGKESSLVLSLLDEHAIPYSAFILDQSSVHDIVKLAHPQAVLTAQRTLDPLLFELNRLGYLNGHVPFSAYLAFLSTFVANLFGHREVLIANERSSNEGNATFHGHEINHQYSKSYTFETAFRQYLTTYLQPSGTYTSFLRPLYELQISQLFAMRPAFEQYAPVFRSCNRGQKRGGIWCGECPKCLFTSTALLPFIGEERTLAIFGKNLFENLSLIEIAKELLGVSTKKPFECVGTHEENVAAWYLRQQWYLDHGRVLPPLLATVSEQVLSRYTQLPQLADSILSAWNSEHHLSPELETLLREALAAAPRS